MRQRSLDEMITYFNQEIDKMDIDRRYKIALLGMVTAIGCTAKQTIEERKKGKWINNGKQMTINLENAREQYAELGYPHRNILRLSCSNCGKVTLVDESIVYSYCPHCGALMKGENDGK